jgi:hypothetical protein
MRGRIGGRFGPGRALVAREVGHDPTHDRWHMMRWHVDLKRQGGVRMIVKRMLFIALSEYEWHVHNPIDMTNAGYPATEAMPSPAP